MTAEDSGAALRALERNRFDLMLTDVDLPNGMNGIELASKAQQRFSSLAVLLKNATCTAFYRKNMTEEVTSLSPEPVTGFILSRKWFRLSDYRLLK